MNNHMPRTGLDFLWSHRVTVALALLGFLIGKADPTCHYEYLMLALGAACGCVREYLEKDEPPAKAIQPTSSQPANPGKLPPKSPANSR
jgi:hypothetical protein